LDNWRERTDGVGSAVGVVALLPDNNFPGKLYTRQTGRLRLFLGMA